ncbi:MAG: hypothetical protein K6T37_08420, partial [Acidothermus cellulolyticus]|nr:hypothetical protein [Acidothermus cellulolyticus]
MATTYEPPASPSRPASGNPDAVTPASGAGHPLLGAEPLTRSAAQTGQIVVLDTSALMADPEGIFDAYPGADLVIPLAVIQELDGLKKRLDPAGAAARDVLRRVEALRLAAGGDLREPLLRRVGGT